MYDFNGFYNNNFLSFTYKLKLTWASFYTYESDSLATGTNKILKTKLMDL